MLQSVIYTMTKFMDRVEVDTGMKNTIGKEVALFVLDFFWLLGLNKDNTAYFLFCQEIKLLCVPCARVYIKIILVKGKGLSISYNLSV